MGRQVKPATIFYLRTNDDRDVELVHKAQS
jgi:hypothetical protein